MATGAELQKMDEAARELLRLMGPALKWAQEQEDSIFGAFTRSGSEDSLLKNIRDTEATADQWFSTWRQWAEEGKNTSGQPSSTAVAFYLKVGKDLGNAFATYSKLQVQAGAFVLGQTVSQSASDLAGGAVRTGEAAKNILNGLEDGAKAFSEPWSWKVKLAVGLAGLALAGLVASKLVDKLPDVPNPLPAGEGGAA